MSVTDEDVHGPIDFVLIEFSGDKFTGEGAAALLDLVESGIVRIYDILVIRKDADGTFSGFEIEDLDVDSVGAFFAFEGARSGLLGDEDVAEAAGAMEPGTVAALIVYEDLWAIPFVAATIRAGGQMIASQRIPALDVMAALDAIEAAG